MDPAASVFFPFHNKVEGNNGLLENAVTELRTDGPNATTSGSTYSGQQENGRKNNMRGENVDCDGGTPCGVCGLKYTKAVVPSGGLYLCADCAQAHMEKSKGGIFPPNTLRCCPASVTDGCDGVVRCHACHGWYHCACLGINDKALKEYIALSTTKWYCMEPLCCEKVLQEKLKKKR